MNFQEIVDSYEMATAVLSVEKTEDGHYGEIRIVCANDIYKQTMGPKYRDNMLYNELIPREIKFEDFCYRSAVLKQHLHTYVDTKFLDVWTDATYVPLSKKVDTEKLSYFIFYFEFTKAPEAERMSDISMEIAPFVIQTCINLRGADTFISGMNRAITDIQEKTNAFSSCIIMIDKQQQKYAPLCSKYRNDEACIEDYMPNLTPDVVFSWEGTLQKHDNIIIKNEFDMCELEKENPIWVKSLRDAKVKSLILAPLKQKNKLFGVLFITDFNVNEIVKLKELIEITAFFLSAEIANNDLMEKLEYMSNIDLLTGVRNRNSMNARVDYHVKGSNPVQSPFGIIFADLNGLKQCNDNGGHTAGDDLLRNAAKLLQKHFSDYEIFRAGGDEFVVIVPGCQKDFFDKKVEELRADSSYGSEVCFAIGSDWTENQKKLRLCMHNADEAMYLDKNKFYEKHPELRRR